VTPGTVITTIDDIKKIKVDFSIPEKYVHSIEPSSKIIVESNAVPGRKFGGDISAISTRVSTTSRSVSVRGIIDNKDYLLRPGMMLKITIQMKDRDAIQLPERAVSNIGEKHYVFVIDKKADKTAVKRRFIVIGERKDDLVEVKDGLKVGETVVIEGIGKLSDKDIVQIADSKQMDTQEEKR
jgi:membrane fusion protein (multidrug efflux system)